MESSNYKSTEVRNEKNDWNRKVGLYILYMFFYYSEIEIGEGNGL